MPSEEKRRVSQEVILFGHNFIGFFTLVLSELPLLNVKSKRARSFRSQLRNKLYPQSAADVLQELRRLLPPGYLVSLINGNFMLPPVFSL